MMKTPKIRLDCLLVDRGLVESLQRAQALILAGAVLVGDRPADKAGSAVPADAEIRIRGKENPYVSRGGLKLRGALDTFGLSVRGLVALDVGASTGGFTDCLLRNGAARVYAIDVGYGQLDYRLRQDPRVTVLERVNIRYLGALPEKGDMATVDVSFISLEKVVPALAKLLKDGAKIVALVKPQFQARRPEVGKKGVVRDPQVHAAVLGRVIAWGAGNGLRLLGLTTSPLLGPAGNKEFFVLWRLPDGDPSQPSGVTP
jgi:23S rRNA (cytidine1920-2'-O)/16S rRNA (cytidine1409-2'-O)-methyltransferase